MAERSRLLYVDDEPVLLEITRLYLERSGEFTVDIFTSAPEALNSIDVQKYDAIIADYQMPDMDGIEFLKAVRERSGDTPFILFTGKGREEVVIEAINNGADFYLQKGGDPTAQFAELSHKVRQAIRRKQAESDRIRSEEKFSKLFIANPSLEAITDFTTGILIDVNEAWVRTTGYARDDVIGKSTREIDLFVDYADRERMATALTNEGILHNAEIRIRTKSGEIRTLDFSGQLIKVGNTDLLFSQAVDITEREQAEEDLRKSEERYRTVVNDLAEMICRFTPDGIVTFANEAYRQYFHPAPGSFEIEGKNIQDLIKAEDYRRVKSFLGNLTPESPIRVVERRMPGPDSTVHWQRWTIRALFDTQGKTTEYQLVGHDVTEQKRGEKELRAAYEKLAVINSELTAQYAAQDESRKRVEQSESKYRSILDNIQDVYYRTDRDGNIAMISPSGAALLGYSSVEELEGFPIAEKIYANPEDRTGFLAEIRKKGSVDDYEVNLRCKDGTIVTVSSNSHFYSGPDGNIAGIEGVFRDITEKKRAEKELALSENLYRAVFDNTGAATIIVAPDTTILKANAGWENLTGVRKENQENRLSWTVFIHGDDVERMKTYHYTRRNDPLHTPTVYECRFVDAGKRVHTCFVHVDIIPGTEKSVASLIDITPLKQAEVALRKSEQEHRSIIENMQDFFYRTDMQGSLTMISPSFASELGYPDAGEILGKNIRDECYFNPSDREELLRRLERDGSVQEHRVVLRRRNGSRIVVSASSHVLYDDDGSPAGVEGILHDISKTVEAEEALRESEKKYHLLAENVRDVIWKIDRDLHVTYISPSVYALRGLTPEEAMAEPLSEAMTPASFRNVLDHHQRMSDTIQRNQVDPEKKNTLEVEFRCKDGSTVWTEMVISPLFDDANNWIGAVGVTRNISSRRKAESALRESEEKFRSIVETSPDIIWEIDLQGKFRYISPMIQAIMGYAPRDLIGRSTADFISAEKKSEMAQELVKARSTGETPRSIEVPALHLDGRRVFLEIRPTRLTAADGTLSGWRGVAVDITERKKAEEALRQVNRQLTLLSSITRHDIVNKISVINGYLRLAETKSSDPGLIEIIRKVESNIGMIQSQIEFTRTYQEIGSHLPQWIEIDQIITRFQVPAPVTLHSGVQGVSVFADTMLEKAFFNLLDNSIRHGERVTGIRISSRKENGDLVIVWGDNGVGIAANEKERIFERGFGKNTGLGMFLVREILSLTGITILENGEPGRGARFEIRVPPGLWRMSGKGG